MIRNQILDSKVPTIFSIPDNNCSRSQKLLHIKTRRKVGDKITQTEILGQQPSEGKGQNSPEVPGTDPTAGSGHTGAVKSTTTLRAQETGAQDGMQGLLTLLLLPLLSSYLVSM